jgi:hypothetical protein
MQYRDSQEAFEQAIKEGRLSDDPKAANYAGLYMYMGTTPTAPGERPRDLFKDINSREYIN